MLDRKRAARERSEGNRVLMTVSGVIPANIAAQVADGRRPRVDYLELAAKIGADLIDYGDAERARSWVMRRVVRVAGPDVGLAWACYRRRHYYDVILTDGEQIGLPLACLGRFSSGSHSARHVMIVHIMSVRKKALLFRTARLRNRIDAWIVYSTAQRRFATNELHVQPERVVLQPFMVDTQFFAPKAQRAERNRPLICTAGLECRDYPTLLKAVDGLDADVVIAAASPWSKRSSGLENVDLPSNVTVVRLDLAQLKALYDESTLVVMPLQPVDFQAGITTILEAMSMGRAVVCTRTAGQTDALIDGETGIYVPVSDAPAMRTAIERALADPIATASVGDAARRWVQAHADVDLYAAAIAQIVLESRR